jgi:hypothetical protein
MVLVTRYLVLRIRKQTFVASALPASFDVSVSVIQYSSVRE